MINKTSMHTFFILMGVVAGILFGCSKKAKVGNTENQIQNSLLLKTPPVFIQLAPGAVTPEGWIRDWAVDASHGISGHLDEYSATFGEAWKGYGFKARGANADGGGWPLEQCAYWLDGAIRLGYILNDSVLIKKVSARLDTVVNGVLRGGETFIYWLPKEALYNSDAGGAEFNSWAHSHMGRALTAYYHASGNSKVLQALHKVYRNFSLPDLHEHFDDVSGSVNIEPMLDTYLLTGDTAILRNILAFGKKATFQTLITNWNKSKLNPGHNVIFYENIRVPSLLYLVSGNKNYLTASIQALSWAEKEHLLPLGLVSGEEYHAGIGATRNVETCNVAAAMNTFNRLLQITGEKVYADKIEKVFFNAAPAPVSRDFKTMCYYQSMNRYSNKLPGHEPPHPGKECYKFTQLGHEVLCCVGNNTRVLPNYIMNMWMGTQDHGLAATLYGPCRVKAEVGHNVSAEIVCQTHYPFRETILMTVNTSKPAEFPIYLRIPEWCKKPVVMVNQIKQTLDTQEGGFVKVLRKWSINDTIELVFPMSANVVQGRETNYPQIPYFRKPGSREIALDKSIQSPFGYVCYGPLLFSFPIGDKNPNQEVEGTKYNYALDVSPKQAEQSIAIVRKVMPDHWNWSQDSPLQLRVNALEFDWDPTENNVLPDGPVKIGKQVEINLVPYGSAKFRVSMFPVSASSWQLP